MVNVIIQGDRAIEVAHKLKSAGLAARAWDLGPDFGETTARVVLVECDGYPEAEAFLERARMDNWLPGTVDDWRPRPDGPPFSGDGYEVSVTGTEIV